MGGANDEGRHPNVGRLLQRRAHAPEAAVVGGVAGLAGEGIVNERQIPIIDVGDMQLVRRGDLRRIFRPDELRGAVHERLATASRSTSN